MSAGLTPILGLPQFDSNDDLSYTEVSDAYAKLDRLPTTICTSMARPITNLYVGRTIFETDTKVAYIWDGDSWELITETQVGSWTTYAATLTAVTTNPTGWTRVYAKYCTLGKTVHVTGRFTCAGAPGVGSGIYFIDLPAAAPLHTDYLQNDIVGSARAQVSTGAIAPMQAAMYSTRNKLSFIKTSNGLFLDNTGPGVAWAANSTIQFSATYERP